MEPVPDNFAWVSSACMSLQMRLPVPEMLQLRSSVWRPSMLTEPVPERSRSTLSEALRSCAVTLPVPLISMLISFASESWPSSRLPVPVRSISSSSWHLMPWAVILLVPLLSILSRSAFNSSASVSRQVPVVSISSSSGEPMVISSTLRDRLTPFLKPIFRVSSSTRMSIWSKILSDVRMLSLGWLEGS